MSVINHMLVALDARQARVPQTKLPDLIQSIQPPQQARPRRWMWYLPLLLSMLLAGGYLLLPWTPEKTQTASEASQADEVFRIAPPGAIATPAHPPDTPTSLPLQLQTTDSLQAAPPSENDHASTAASGPYLVRARNNTP